MMGALPPVPATARLRAVLRQDEPFLLRLYHSVRAPELLLLPWSEAEKRAFVADQFRLQQAHYRKNCPGAAYWIVEDMNGCAIGRLSLDRTGAEWRLIELALLPEARSRGIGTQLIGWVQQAARTADAEAVTLHVEVTNQSACRLYRRLGFMEAPSQFATHRFLRWTV